MAEKAVAGVSGLIVGDKRLDGRTFEEFRPAFLNAGTHSKAKGSAYAEFGRTKVLVGVYGPRESDSREAYSDSGRIQCDIKRLKFSAAPLPSAKQAQIEEDREDASTIQLALEAAVQLEAYPKSVVDIFCVVLESGGSDLAALITTASMAIADAGIPMFDLVTSCYISRVSSHLLLDPSSQEACREDGGCLLAVMPQLNKVTHFAVTGQWSMSQLTELMELGLGACAQLDGTVHRHEITCSASATDKPDSVVTQLLGDYDRVEFPARHNILFSKALKEFTKTAVLAYECGYTEQFLRDGASKIITEQRSVDQAALDKCVLCVALVWITLSLPPLKSKRWAVGNAVSQETHEKWKGFVCLIMKGYFEKRWAAYPIGRLQMEVSLMTGRMERPDVIAELSRIVFSTLECVAPQWPSK